MAEWHTVTPAYGRDYTRAADVKKDWKDGKDFVLQSPFGSTYCSIRDFAPGGTLAGSHVHARYARLAKLVQLQ